MIRFECDYAEGAYPRVLEILGESNLNQTTGYGNDEYCQKAKELIKKACNSPNSDVHFMVGGTQTNATVIAAALRPHQGVISAETGHINVHETGAIEFSGHKVIALSSGDGKITADQIRQCVVSHWEDAAHEHMVQPGMVYISHPTENGTLYTKEELTKISQTCKEFNLPLFMDGARLGYGLMAEGSDITLEDLCKLCDIFYIGGTKIGALFGEALVINNESLKKDFRYFIKQNGAMLAKGRLLGIQFIALFEDNAYFNIARHANEMAYKIKNAFMEMGYKFRYNSSTNQQFPIIPDEKLEILKKKYAFSFWEKYDENHTVVRVCTSWATKEENVVELINDIKN